MADSLLSRVERTPRGHFRLHFYAAVFRLLYQLGRLTDNAGGLDAFLARFPFLAHYLEQTRPYLPPQVTWPEAIRWWQTQIAAWEADCPGILPLRELAAQGIDFRHRLALVLAGLVEEDGRFGTLFADLQQPMAQRRPALELLGRLVGGDGSGEADPWALCRPLLTAGLLDVADRTGPRATWELTVPPDLWDVIRGEPAPATLPWCQYRGPETLPELDDLLLPAETRAQLAQLPALVGAGKARTLVLRAMQGSDRLEALGAVARALDRGLLAIDGTPSAAELARVGPLCTLTHSMPVFRYDPGPGEAATLPDLPGYSGPVGVLLSFAGGLKGRLAEQAISIHLPLPTLELRRRCWQQALGAHPAPDLEEAAARYHIPGGYIRQAGAIAIARAALDRREHVTLADIQAATRQLGRQVLDTLATRLEADGSWETLVVSPAVGAKLRELELRCRHRERLLAHLSPVYGAGANGRGVRALLGGPSGTGKTLAAKTLAAVLGMDLYRVDLAAVINKYIGETEKNLNQVLSLAEELDVILLLDEGDSLLAKRSDVKSANDRHANMETNYLLQRFESYQGIVLVTTNAGENVDGAFQRRMDVVVNFMPPQPQERLQIWHLHLPAGHQVPAGFLQEIALRCTVTGGQIRNAALHATLLAVDAGTPVRRPHLEEAIRSEYSKAGAICPLDATAAHGPETGVGAFLKTMRG